jgi:hypothetical protein
MNWKECYWKWSWPDLKVLFWYLHGMTGRNEEKCPITESKTWTWNLSNANRDSCWVVFGSSESTGTDNGVSTNSYSDIVLRTWHRLFVCSELYGTESITVESWQQIPRILWKPSSSLQSSQEPATDFCPQLDESISHVNYFWRIHKEYL